MKVLIDVRTKEEWDTEHVPQAVHHDLTLLMQGQMPEIPKDAEVYLYCRSGARSGVAADILRESGFMFVKNLGGYPPSLDGIY